MDKILTNLKHGWCDFNLCDYKGKPSYIRFLPLDILDAYEEYLKSHHCIIEFDEETTQFCLVIWEYEVLILDNRRTNISINELKDVNAEELLKELVNEVCDNIYEWAEWISTTGTEENIKSAENMIKKRIKEVGIIN